MVSAGGTERVMSGGTASGTKIAGGTLTITDGKLTAAVTLFGNYVAGGFKLASDGAAGTAVTYVSATAAHHDVLAKVG